MLTCSCAEHDDRLALAQCPIGGLALCQACQRRGPDGASSCATDVAVAQARGLGQPLGAADLGRLVPLDLAGAFAGTLTPAAPSLESRLVAALAHGASFLNFFVPCLASSAVIWLLRLGYGEDPFVEQHTRVALVQQLFWVGVLLIVLPLLLGQLYLLLIAPLLVLVGVFQSACGVAAALAGRSYRYFPTSYLADQIGGYRVRG